MLWQSDFQNPFTHLTFYYCSFSKIMLLLTSFSRAQNVRCIHSSTNGIILDFGGVNLSEEYHGLMKSTDDSKSYLGISTSYSTKLLNETVTVNTIDWQVSLTFNLNILIK